MSHHPGDFRTWEMLARQKSERLQREHERRVALGIANTPRHRSVRGGFASLLRGLADRLEPQRQPEVSTPARYSPTGGNAR